MKALLVLLLVGGFFAVVGFFMISLVSSNLLLLLLILGLTYGGLFTMLIACIVFAALNIYRMVTE